MEDREGRFARHVAEAADAWLRDPLDAEVYRRLVAATLAWRARAAPGGRGIPGRPDLTADGVAPAPGSDDERFLRPERAPQRLGGGLDGVASMLRARADAARSRTDAGIDADTPTSTGTDVHATPTESQDHDNTAQERDDPA